MGDTKGLRRIVLLVAAAAVVIGLFAALRGSHVSDALKGLILPELELMSGRKVTAQKIYINLFPLFAEARGLKVAEESGTPVLAADRVKAYIDISGLLNRTIVIRRLVVRQPAISLTREGAEDIARHVKAYLAAERRDAVKVKVRAVELDRAEGGFSLPEEEMLVSFTGLSGELLDGDVQRIMVTTDTVTLSKKGMPDIKTDAAASLVLKGGDIQVKKFLARSFGSKLSGSGDYQGGRGSFLAEAEVLFDSLKSIFGLKQPGGGQVKAKGTLQLADTGVMADLSVDGSFYIQTLMELLKVKERVEGRIQVAGKVKGPLKDLRVRGTATLAEGNLFDVAVDRLGCAVVYERGTMSFTGGTARLYGGDARVEASIALPVVDRYTVNVDFRNVDSIGVFKLIGWDPGIAPGKVTGSLRTSGPSFEPSGSFVFTSLARGKDVLGRVKGMTGQYGMSGSVVTLRGLTIDTGLSTISAEGAANIADRTLKFDGKLHSRDVTDLTAPYYGKVKGVGDFSGTVTGTFDDPLITGHVGLSGAAFEHYAIDRLAAEVVYRKNLLSVKKLEAAGPVEVSLVSGTVRFGKAKTIFDLASPEYGLTAVLSEVDLDRFARIFYPDFRGTGRIRADMQIRGDGDRPSITGTGSVSSASLYGVPIDSASFNWGYQDRKLSFTSVKMLRGRSAVTGNFAVDEEGVFSYRATSDRLLLSDAVGRELKGDAVFSLTSQGTGTFDNPDISIRGKIIEGRLRGKPVGSGSLTAVIKERIISLQALLFNEKLRVTGKGRLEKDIPWEADVSVRTARYDAVLSAFLKDIPEDLILSLNGEVKMKGDRNHISASAVITQLALSMYGYSFANDHEIRLQLQDRRLTLNKITLKGGGTSLSISGSLQAGKSYSVDVEGSASLAPFKSLSTKVSVLRGDADFVMSVTGDWDQPQINGGVTLTNGSFGLKDYAYRISAISGYLYMDNDRVVLQQLSGKMGGGDIDISGIVYLKKFAYRRFYLEAELKNISASPSHDFAVNFGGRLLYKGTPESQAISGDLAINRARYRERVEWKSWLLKARQAEKVKGEIAGLEKAELNIRIAGKENIFLDNNVARATVSADMILRGTVSRPVLYGRIDTSDGAVFFRNNEFRILRASAAFFDPLRINPIVQIAAETMVKGYKIKMNLEGQLDRFAVSFSSDPMLKEADILSLLTVGQTSGELKGLEGGIGAGEATSFVTGKLQDVVEERMRNITGLDRFQIDSYVSKKTGTAEPRVTVSKRLMGDKLFVTYGSSVGSTDEQIIKLEYFLSRSISLVGLRDERGIVGGDVRFRFEFK